MNLKEIMQKLKELRGTIPRQTLLTIRGQALSGDLKGAERGIIKCQNTATQSLTR